MKKLFIAGCGYIGRRVARLARDAGYGTTCLVRSAEHGEALERSGFGTLVATLDDPAGIPALEAAAGGVVLYCVPPPGGGLFDTRARHFCAAMTAVSPPPAMIVYLGATSVYSETRGGVVTEDSPVIPASAMGKRRLDAEATFREFGAAHGTAVVILRVSGIYGPGRLPLMQISQGQPLLREEESGPSNRIHADDLAQVCLAAVEKGENGAIFNISDGHPASMTSYFNAAADALGMPRQPQVTLDEARQAMSPLMFSYVSESRVVDNSRMLEKLGVRLRYPTMAQGLAASVEAA
ncbi:SDR family oxidoreductase [Oryzomonas sagensis]|uniref:SDR family oxidoreductase n=1 Tax=Oryzomonas sagensis TaxID=2603857 RepID=A0ABQ6TRK9_9BACT|nr:SDR family oxidoreductase [Oryzomonas sagensis]KAB0671414.1 SDR family oxidoreductase [Oryzomonas sagensis]